MDSGRTVIEFSPMRAAIARRMVESKQQAPHFYVETEITMDQVLAVIAESSGGASDRRVTVTACLVRACAVALRSHPRLNAVWTARGLEQVEKVNLGVAVALEHGLVAPAVLGADSLPLVETAEAVSSLVERARRGKLRAAELSEASFTLSNLGKFHVTRFTAIVVPPQVGILATGRIVERPMTVDGEVVSKPILAATVSADHRAVDGADVASFLTTFKSLVENPERLSG